MSTKNQKEKQIRLTKNQKKKQICAHQEPKEETEMR